MYDSILFASNPVLSVNVIKFQVDISLFNRGLYTVAEASRLTGVPAETFRRWVFGYRRKRKSGRIEYEPIAAPEIGQIEGHYVVGFRDLLEARVVQAFRKAGVSWHIIHLAAENSRTPERSTHPFLSKRFRTDGRTIFQESIKAAGNSELVDLAKNQHAFHSVIAPSLFRQIVFDAEDTAIRWYPLWPRQTVVLDPRRSFGRPIVSNVPAETLAAAVKAERSADTVARWYNIPSESVRAAVEWQERLAA
jgi:uncharacterized protein (DUF433 family)